MAKFKPPMPGMNPFATPVPGGNPFAKGGKPNPFAKAKPKAKPKAKAPKKGKK